MPQSKCLLLLAAGGMLLPHAPLAAADTPPIVPGFERFGAAKPDAKGGQLLLSELNCVSCHAPADPSQGRKQAPILDAVASRVRVSFLRKFLTDPHGTKPGTTMPDLFAGDPEKAQKVEALVHFLATSGSLKQERPNLKGIVSGWKLYQEVGCVACHGARDGAGNLMKALPTSVPLGDLKSKYSITSLAAFLENPQHVRPGGRMPRLLESKEAKDVANYLLQGLKGAVADSPGTTKYAYYEGEWDQLPNFEKLKPIAVGTGAAFDLTAARREGNYALKFDGFFRTEQDGEYRFSTTSDDGSKLYVDGKEVVDNDGIHAPQSKSGTVRLSKGAHQVSVTFLQGGGGAELSVIVEGPGLGTQDFAAHVAASEAALGQRPPPVHKDDEDRIEVQAALAEKGKALFATMGCANCHQMVSDKKTLTSTLKVPALDQLKGSGGCLADTPTKGLPLYSLNTAQKSALAAAIRSPSLPSKDPAEVIARTMTTFNCYACHERGKVGGPEDEFNKFFLTTQPEMGDEGRVPPPLNGVGAKLNADYMQRILDQGAHDRPYMHTRMPAFGSANVGHLAAAFAALDKLPAIPDVEFPMALPKVKAIARHMCGDNSLGCIKCHTFAGNKAEGVQGIDMTLMPRRLKRDWFHAYLVDPQKIRPGTRMPTAWPNGQSVLPDLLGGKSEVQIEAIWVYLKDGANAQLPAGLRKHPIPLVPTTGAIVYRNFIQGAGTRAIAIGYPEKVHLAFDANDLRLALLWQGAFMDAARHWNDRGAGSEPPLGDNILHLPAGVSFAVLTKPDQPWPTARAKELGYKFGGYRLTPDDRPTFLYTLGEVKVEEFPNPGKGSEPSLRRELKLSGSQATENLYFRAAVGAKIDDQGNGWFRIDGWKMKLEGGIPQVRQANGKTELLLPIRFEHGEARITQEFVW
jgi:mono/diheme cytochrome c family protein